MPTLRAAGSRPPLIDWEGDRPSDHRSSTREFLIDWDKPEWGQEGQNIHITVIDESEEHHDHCVKHCKCTHCRERREDA